MTRPSLLRRQNEITVARKEREMQNAAAAVDQFASLNRHQRRAWASRARRKARA